MSARTETPRLIGEKPVTPDGFYQPLTDLALTKVKLKGLSENIVWNHQVFEVIADTFATIKKATGHADDTKPIEISDVSIGYEESANASKGEPMQKAWVHYPNSRDNLRITFSRYLNGSVEVLVNSRDDDERDVQGHLESMNHGVQQFRPPARGIDISKKDEILALLLSGIK